jgi:hypothetical protein
LTNLNTICRPQQYLVSTWKQSEGKRRAKKRIRAIKFQSHHPAGELAMASVSSLVRS